MKNEQIQEVRSSGVLLILGLIGFSAAIIATPWNRQMQDSSIETALQKAEVVGYQVVQIYREASKIEDSGSQNGKRSPASIPENASAEGFPANLRSTGTMGLDPWGTPYHYRILSADKSGKVRILVWSAGPNKNIETPELDDEDTPLHGQPIYAGDDIGVLLSMTHN